MSTLISYLLAAILQFIGASMPTEQETVSALNHQQCIESNGLAPYSFIINNEQKFKKQVNEKL
ncbi:hypothetical protein K8089_04545 [Aequorivita sp. F47161]|jgi:predicted tellurium resistance membrane protein TerC|uniref:Uncharacterized protein n=1 Tax=Aequorivita vitellina TaxID=2874475 RepID=A0A9X1U994_9FLAO|nr:hypothetical protein [Aequorivita vitellina]MCG2418281.1 hypothetical protein [Aequorivita vitellina]MCZ4319427.1 hypothetical protein [Aequorivita viscosa]